jgi:RND superfamily putative drug exporter
MLTALARLVLRRSRTILILFALLVALSAVIGVPVISRLTGGGFQDANSESAKTTAVLTEKFGVKGLPLVLLVTSANNVLSEAGRMAGMKVVDAVSQSEHVGQVSSPWTVPPAAADSLISRDEKTAAIVTSVVGGDIDGPKYAVELGNRLSGQHRGVSVAAGGMSIAEAQVVEFAQRDLVMMEVIAMPLTYLILVWIFGGLIASLVPLLVSLGAISSTLAILRIVAEFTDVSVYALNLATALGFALAIDYTLLIVNRYRTEVRSGASCDEALVCTIHTAGKTVLFSGAVVASGTATMIVFPIHALRSIGVSATAVIIVAAVAAFFVGSSALGVLQLRINALDVRQLHRRIRGKGEVAALPIEDTFLYRLTSFVIRRALPVGMVVFALLVIVGLPFLRVNPSFSDDRALPTSASARTVGEFVRQNFADNILDATPIVLSYTGPLRGQDLIFYSASLSRVAGVSKVSAPTGTYADGKRIGEPSLATGINGNAAFLTVTTTSSEFSRNAVRVLDNLKAVQVPGGARAFFGGVPQLSQDIVHSVRERLPYMYAVIVVSAILLLLLLTGSFVLPWKAIVLNLLSLTTTFGAMVWIFQDGHLGGFGTMATDSLNITTLVVLFAGAFGLSMDYEVFLLARIREHWASSSWTREDNDEAVRAGVAESGRVITAAALLMCIAFLALSASQVSLMRMLGVGLALAIIVDATLVRLVLVPALMHVMGKFNWWAPSWFTQWHQGLKSTACSCGHVAAHVDFACRRCPQTSVAGSAKTPTTSVRKFE